MRKYISAMLRNARENANLKQIDVAKKLSVGNKSVSHWEKANAMPCLEDAIKLADLYGISLDTLVGHKPVNDNRISLTSDEMNIIRQFRTLNYIGKEKIISYLSDISNIQSYTIQDEDKEKVISA